MNNYPFYPLVTIVIPVYKGSNYVQEAIESALKQTYKNIEILVINDGSDDNDKTKNAVEPFLDRVKYIEKKNGGVSSVLNLAFQVMNGEWMSWLSHDDLYYPEKIARQIEFLSKEKLSSNDKVVVVTNYDFIDEKGKLIHPPFKNKLRDNMSNLELILNNIKRNYFSGITFLIPKKSYYTIGKFDEELKTISDYDYWYRMLFADFRFLYIDEILASNRMHSNQVTYKKSDLAKRESIEFHKRVFRGFLTDNNLNNKKNLLKLAFFIDVRGVKCVPNLIYNHITELDKSLLTQIYIIFKVIFAKIKYSFRFFLKYLYTKLFILRKK